MGIRVGDYGATVAQASPVRFGVFVGAIATAIAIGIAAGSGNPGPPPPTLLRYPNLVGGSYTVGSANVWLAPNGSDSGANCIFSSVPVPAPSPASTACATYDKADSLAQGGSTNTVVGVIPGTYPAAAAAFGFDNYILNHGSNTVTFECQTGASADGAGFTAPDFLYWAVNVTFLGSCFHFHELSIGLRGSSPSPTCGSTNGVNSYGPVTLNGVHIDAFDITGSCNATLQNSQVGPIIACYGTGLNGGVGECPTTGPLASITAYWAPLTGGSPPCGGTTAVVQDQPFIHNDGTTTNENTVLNNDYFYGMNTMTSDLSGSCGGPLHQGGLLIWGSDGTIIENTDFQNNTIYDIEYNAGTTETNATVQNTVFGPPVQSNETSNSLTPPVLTTCQEGIGNIAGQTFTNILYRYNTFTDCENVGNAGSTFSNVRFVANLIGNSYTGGGANCVATTGISYSSNVVANGGSACQGGGTLAGNPFTNVAGLDFSLGTSASPPVNYVACASGDANLTSDHSGNPRPKNTNCDAGAYENK